MNDFNLSHFFPDWEIDGVLGSGPFGTVYLAHTLVEGKAVYGAVKVITTPPDRKAVENARKMGISLDLLKTYFAKFKSDLEWELTMFGGIESKRLVPCEEFSFEEAEDAGWTACLRTQIYTPLDTYFEKVEPTSEDAARLGAELAAALVDLSSKDAVHGDIIPENVMVADSGAFMLADYGVKRSLEKAGSSIFGPSGSEFEAPELGKERNYTVRGDIYSLGVLMLYVANNCRLPEGLDADAVKGIDPALAAVIKKAMAKDPEERYATALELFEAITRLELFRNRRPQRRAVAAAAAFDKVKKNGSTIRKEQPKEPEPEVRKIKYPNDKKDENKTAKKIGKLVPILIVEVLAIAALAIVIFNPFHWFRPDTNGKVPDSTVNTLPDEDTHQNTVIIEDNPTVTAPDESGTGDNNTGDSVTEPDPIAGTEVTPPEDTTNPEENPGENGTDPGETVTPPDPVEETPTYFLPSDSRLLTEEDVAGFTKHDFRLAINELYARHGYHFGSKEYRTYFANQSWYEDLGRNQTQCDRLFSEIETQNRDFLLKNEQNLAA